MSRVADLARALSRAAALAGIAGSAAQVISLGWQRRPPGGHSRWTRTNHRGEPISLAQGPALVLGTATAALLAPGIPPRLRWAALVAGVGAGALGAYDDLAEGQVRKGLAGHLGALAQGEVTTGAIKIGGLSVTGLVSAALVGGGPGAALLGGAVIAGSANFVNLLDLRPGRALKVVLVVAPAAFGAGPAAIPAGLLSGAAASLITPDLAERTMLGDTGANAAGALLGLVVVAGCGRRGRLLALAGLALLTAASERVSFTAVIERTPGLRELDGWGRRPR